MKVQFSIFLCCIISSTAVSTMSYVCESPHATCSTSALALPRHNANSGVVYYVDWKHLNSSTNTLTGVLATPSALVEVVLTSSAGFATGYSTADIDGSGPAYWAKHPAATTSPYESAIVPDGPSLGDIARFEAATNITITFNPPVYNVFLAFAGASGNQVYSFNNDFEILSQASSATNRGYFGHGEASRVDTGTSYDLQEMSGEPHGMLLFQGSFSRFQFTVGANNNWDGITFGSTDSQRELSFADVNNGSTYDTTEKCSATSAVNTECLLNFSCPAHAVAHLTITNNIGQESSCETNISFVDNEAPWARCKDTIIDIGTTLGSAGFDGSYSLTADTIDAGSVDGCNIASRSLNKTDFTCSDTGIHYVLLSVTDESGNSASCTATVNISGMCTSTTSSTSKSQTTITTQTTETTLTTITLTTVTDTTLTTITDTTLTTITDTTITTSITDTSLTTVTDTTVTTVTDTTLTTVTDSTVTTVTDTLTTVTETTVTTVTDTTLTKVTDTTLTTVTDTTVTNVTDTTVTTVTDTVVTTTTSTDSSITTGTLATVTKPPSASQTSVVCSGGIVLQGLMLLNELVMFDSVTNEWTTVDIVGDYEPIKRREHTAVLLDGTMFLFGGDMRTTRALAAAEACDLTTSTCERRKDMPVGRRSHGIGVIDRMIYIFGGILGGGVLSDDVLSSTVVYDIEKDEYTNGPAMNSVRTAMGYITVENKIYVCGGMFFKSGGYVKLSTCEMLDKKSGQWTILKPMKSTRSHFDMAEKDGFLYVMGGQTSMTVEKYSIGNDEWSSVSSLPGPFKQLQLFSAFFASEELIVFGGDNFTTPNDMIFKYNVSSGKWLQEPNTQVPLRVAMGCSLEHKASEPPTKTSTMSTIFTGTTTTKLSKETCSCEINKKHGFR
eukprot:m.170006 g.170006  ORF g.170006 m.170006 type:complete len:896 (+) comp15334_c0_seq2:58-2745(+)